MDDDTKSLLTRIGQPDFAYRDFADGDVAAMLARWPLLGVIAAEPRLAATPIATRSRGRRDDGPGQAGGGFLTAYDTARRGGASDGAGDVRALLNRLAEDRK